MKLTQEEKDAILEIEDMPGFAALKKLASGLVESVQSRVLSYPMTSDGADLKKLAALKCAAEGAESLSAAIWKEVDGLKKSFVTASREDDATNVRRRRSA